MFDGVISDGTPKQVDLQGSFGLYGTTVTAVIKMVSANPNRDPSSEPLGQSAQILLQFAGICLLMFGGLAGWEYLRRDQRVALLFNGLATGTRLAGRLRDGDGRYHADLWVV